MVDRFTSHDWGDEYQALLATKSVAVIGRSFGADLAAICLQCLGFGHAHLIGQRQEDCFLTDDELRAITPSCSVGCWDLDMDMPLSRHALPSLDGLLAGGGHDRARVEQWVGATPLVALDGAGPASVQGICAGMGAELLRATVAPLEQECADEPRIQVSDAPTLQRPDFVIAGCGGLGTIASLVLSYACVQQHKQARFTLIDPDIPERRNLNRQFFYALEQGNKAEVLAESLAARYPHEYVAVPQYLEKCSARHFRPGSVLVGCLDNSAARATAAKVMNARSIPYVDGGAGAHAGQVATYLPGDNVPMTPGPTPAQRASCQDNPIPSVITTNIVVGSCLAHAALYVASTGERMGFRYAARPRIALRQE